MEPLAVDMGETQATAGGSEVENELLAAFYAFTYEDAVLVGPSGSPRSRLAQSGQDSPRKRPPSQPRSPTRQDANESTAIHLTASLEDPQISREILNALIPPKTWRDTSGKWQRVARATPSNRADVIQLEALFQQVLHAHQARASAICPVREKYFLQVFEELIRQCACECPARGLLLLRLRDELRLRLQSYQTLYHRSIAFGRQKAVQADAGIAELEDRMRELQHEQQQLCERQQQLTVRLLHTEATVRESEYKRAQQQRQRVKFLHDQRTQLQTFYNELTQ